MPNGKATGAQGAAHEKALRGKLGYLGDPQVAEVLGVEVPTLQTGDRAATRPHLRKSAPNT